LNDEKISFIRNAGIFTERTRNLWRE